MSSQKGNVRKSGGPKHKNRSAFKNSMHDTSKRTQQINEMSVDGVCVRCKEIVDWRIKYKKYKPLTQPKKCVKCQQKTVKKAYYIMCRPCASEQKVCAKCAQSTGLVLQPGLTPEEEDRQQSELNCELRQMSERKRRTFFRLQESGKLTDECAKTKDENVDLSNDEFYDECEDMEEGELIKEKSDQHGETHSKQNIKSEKHKESTATDESQNVTSEINTAVINLKPAEKDDETNNSKDEKERVEVGIGNVENITMEQNATSTNQNRNQEETEVVEQCNCNIDHSHCVNNNGCNNISQAIANVQLEKLL